MVFASAVLVLTSCSGTRNTVHPSSVSFFVTRQVAFLVDTNFLHPERVSQPFMLAAYRASMPKTSVQKNYDSFSGQYHVGVPGKSPACRRFVTLMSEVPDTSTPQPGGQCSFRASPSPVMRHRSMALRRRHRVFPQASSPSVASLGSSPCIFLTSKRKSSWLVLVV